MTKDTRSAQARLQEIERLIRTRRGLKSITLYPDIDEESSMRCEFRFADDDGKQTETCWLSYSSIEYFACMAEPTGLGRERELVACTYQDVRRSSTTYEILRGHVPPT